MNELRVLNDGVEQAGSLRADCQSTLQFSTI
jgi:hypothetical protein